MPLIDQVKAICDRLGPLGWQAFLKAATGDQLNIQQNTNAALKTQLSRNLTSIDRSLPGLADFSPTGNQGITPGQAARSLLYHALASPLVVRDHLGNAFGGFPTPAELDIIENYIFGAAPLDLDSFVSANGGSTKVAAVIFSYEYRPAADSVDGHHADLVFSRTGIARVGTAQAKYLPSARGFWPEDEANANRIRVVPAKFAAWIAVKRKGADTRIGRILDDEDAAASEKTRDFWVPVHKLFDGDECLQGEDLALSYMSRLLNIKIQRIHRSIGTNPLPSGFPYVIEDAEIGAISVDGNLGPGWLIPTARQSLVEPAIVNGVPITFESRPQRIDDFATYAPGQPGVPEYVHARTRVTGSTFEDLNEHLDVVKEMRRRKYQALHYIDFTGEGWVTLSGSPAGSLDVVPAYALVSAPDLFPSSGQYELSEWSRSTEVPGAYRDAMWSIQPTPLSETRLPANLQLPQNPFKRTDTTITAVVSMGPPSAPLPIWPVQPDVMRASSLPDDGAGVFAPGWDVATDAARISNRDVAHLAGYVLGSPFPEDAKLCAALSTFWPAVAPDVFRTFVKVTGRTNGTIAPLTDDEIGQSGTLPWDGIPGPREVVVGSERFVEFPSFRNADYVRQSVENRFSIRLLGRISVEEYQARMVAACRVFSVLSGAGNIRAERDRWLLLSFRPVLAGDTQLQQAQTEAGAVLQGTVYAVRLCLSDGVPTEKIDARTERMPLRNDTRIYVSASSIRVLIKRANDLRFGVRLSE